MNRKTAKELSALLQIAQARREERTIAEIEAELAARALAGTPDSEPRENSRSGGRQCKGSRNTGPELQISTSIPISTTCAGGTPK